MENRTPKSVLLTWVVIVTLFILSLFALGERPSPLGSTVSLTSAFSPDEALPAVTQDPDAPPSRNFFTTNSPTLTWTGVSWAAGYEIQISISPNFSALVNVPNPLPADKLHYTAVYLPQGEYYWRVRALDAQNKPGAWSTLEHITISLVVPTMTSTPSFTYTATPTSSPTPKPGPTATMSSQPPFDCSRMSVYSYSLSDAKIFISLRNQNIDATVIQRVVFIWPTLDQFSAMYLYQMALDNHLHWQGMSVANPYPAQNITDTDNDSYITGILEIDRTIAGFSTGQWSATFNLAPTNLDQYSTISDYGAIFYLYDPLHPSTPCVLQFNIPLIPSLTPTVTITRTATVTTTFGPSTPTYTPTPGEFPTNPPQPPTMTPTSNGTAIVPSAVPDPPPTLPGGCVDNCG